MSVAVLAAPAYTQPVTGNSGEHTVQLPSLAELTVQLPRLNFSPPAAPAAQVWGDDPATERRHWVHYVTQELRAMLYIMSALTLLAVFLLAMAPGPLLGAPSL